MKRLLLLLISILMIASVAMADHIAIYSDAAGQGCNLAPGFSTTAAIIHKFTTGATGSRFRMDATSAPGTNFFAFSTPFVPIGDLRTDLSLGYGQCYSGSIVLGTIIAIWAPGSVSIVPALSFPNIIYTACDFAEHTATGGHTSINGDGHGCNFDAVEAATWGKVKALYR